MQKKKTHGPAKAYKNPEFLLSPEARTIRLLCEYVEPQTRLARQGASRAIIFWGSARIRPKPKSGTPSVASPLMSAVRRPKCWPSGLNVNFGNNS